MKKLIVKIGNKIHELPYNGEAYSVEVGDKYVPQVGDCVKVECINQVNTSYYWFKVKEVAQAMVDFSFAVGDIFPISKNGFFNIDDTRNYTKITPEELKAKYAEAGYEWDYETDTIKPLKWMPKDEDDVWWLSPTHEPVKYIFDKEDAFLQLMLEKDLLFKTEEECQKFADYCMSYIKNKKE